MSLGGADAPAPVQRTPEPPMRRPGIGLALRALAAVAAHPGTWAGALGSARRAAPRGWWHRPPFLPVPDATWWAMRTEVAYGPPGGEPTPEELRELFTWSARMRRWRRR